MIQQSQLNAIHDLLNELTMDLRPGQVSGLFGNKIVILADDFRQTLPVIPRATRSQVADSLISRSYLWPYFKKFPLTINERIINLCKYLPQEEQKRAAQFAHYILDIGNGKSITHKQKTVTIPAEYVFNSNQSKQEFVEWVYPEFSPIADPFQNLPSIHERAILCPLNSDADEINNIALELHENDIELHESADAPPEHDDSTYHKSIMTPELLNSIDLPRIPPHKLYLKRGVPLLLLRNLNVLDGLCNGTKLEYDGICHKYLMRARIVGGERNGTIVLMPRIKFTCEEAKYSFNFTRIQYPTKLCFGMTINKAQGQTLKRVGIYLPKPVFGHGQLYVALSRSGVPSQTKIYVPKPNDTEWQSNHRQNSDGSVTTINEVWHECFL